jgi:uncharacterized membrane protein
MLCAIMEHPIAGPIAENVYWAFIAVLFLNLYQRKYRKTGERKRFATLYWAMAFLVFYVVANVIVREGLHDLWLIPAIAVIGGVLAYFRQHTFPFRFRCQRSGKRLDFETMLCRDSNILPEYEEPQQEDQDQGDASTGRVEGSTPEGDGTER